MQPSDSEEDPKLSFSELKPLDFKYSFVHTYPFTSTKFEEELSICTNPLAFEDPEKVLPEVQKLVIYPQFFQKPKPSSPSSSSKVVSHKNTTPSHQMVGIQPVVLACYAALVLPPAAQLHPFPYGF